MSINNVTLTGHLGNNVEVKTTSNGGKVGLLNLAVDDNYIDKKTGNTVERTYWIRCVSFQPKFVESLAKYATKGRLVGVEGKLSSRTYTTKEGGKRTVTEIILSKVTYLSSNNNPVEKSEPTNENESVESNDLDEIPF